MLIIFKELTKQFEQSLLDSLEKNDKKGEFTTCLLYTSDAADD